MLKGSSILDYVHRGSGAAPELLPPVLILILRQITSLQDSLSVLGNSQIVVQSTAGLGHGKIVIEHDVGTSSAVRIKTNVEDNAERRCDRDGDTPFSGLRALHPISDRPGVERLVEQ